MRAALNMKKNQNRSEQIKDKPRWRALWADIRLGEPDSLSAQLLHAGRLEAGVVPGHLIVEELLYSATTTVIPSIKSPQQLVFEGSSSVEETLSHLVPTKVVR